MDHVLPADDVDGQLDVEKVNPDDAVLPVLVVENDDGDEKNDEPNDDARLLLALLPLADLLRYLARSRFILAKLAHSSNRLLHWPNGSTQ